MTDSHGAEDLGAMEHHGPTFRIYLVIFGALCVFTTVSFLVNAMVNADMGISPHAGMAIIMGVAVCKATLVGMFFMHLKYEWIKLYFLIIPVGVLCVMMIIVLMPDGVVYWHVEAAAHAAQMSPEKQP